MKIEDYLHLYIGAKTNLGILSGITEKSCFLVQDNGAIIEHNFQQGEPLKLILKRINDLTVEESSELNRKGLSIGRPNGYSFTPDAILYLLSLRVDLFDLIGKGFAVDVTHRWIVIEMLHEPQMA